MTPPRETSLSNTTEKDHVTSSSDDEIIFSEFDVSEEKKIFRTKELKQRLGCEKRRETVSCSLSGNGEENRSLQIIEAMSEPDLLIGLPKINRDVENPHTLSNNPNKIFNMSHSDDDSFLELEKIVAEPSISDEDDDTFDNTLDAINHILKNGPGYSAENYEIKYVGTIGTAKTEREIFVGDECILNNGPKKESVETNEIKYTGTRSTAKTGSEISVKPEKQTSFTPCKNNTEASVLELSSEKKFKLPVFQPPLVTVPQKRTTSLIKKTPLKTNSAYDHVSSPVASYIRNCPQSPLVKNINLNKAIPGPSGISRLVKTTEPLKFYSNNKENFDLPVVGYKMAKNVKLVDVPNAKKLPGSHPAKESALSAPKAMIIKHERRENNTKKKLEGEMSINLTLNEAEMSVCTQKSAVFINPKPL